MSNKYQVEIAFLAMDSSPSSVQQRFIRTLKGQLLWVRTFQTSKSCRVLWRDVANAATGALDSQRLSTPVQALQQVLAVGGTA